MISNNPRGKSYLNHALHFLRLFNRVLLCSNVFSLKRSVSCKCQLKCKLKCKFTLPHWCIWVLLIVAARNTLRMKDACCGAVKCHLMQCSAVKWSAAQCCAVLCCTVLCCAVLYCTVMCCAALYSAVLCIQVKCITVKWNAVGFNTVQHSEV